MKLKKILAGVLAANICLSLCACGEIAKKDKSELDSLIGSSQTDSKTDSAADDSWKDDSSQIEIKTTPSQLYELMKGYETKLDISPEFFEWCVETTGDTEFIEKVYNDISANGYSDDKWYSYSGMTVKATKDLYSGIAYTQDNYYVLDGDGEDGISLIFGGDINLDDTYYPMERLSELGSDIEKCISPYLIEKLNGADIASLNSEFCFSDRGTAMAGKQWTFRGKTENIWIYEKLGLDIVLLANNHIFDFGEDAFYDTLDTLTNAGIEYMGAGRDIAEASAPVYYIIEGKKIAFVAATRAEKYILTPEAKENEPGVLRCYDPAAYLEVIREAKENADYVVASVHWGKEHSHGLEDVQPETGYQYIEAGADVIIGSHAHCLQGIEYYNGKPIVYNLGNFWFDGYDIDTGLLELTINDDDSVTLQFIPASQKNSQTTYVGGEAEGERILQCLRDYSFNVEIDENGYITEKMQ